MENSKIPPCGCLDEHQCDFSCIDFSIKEVSPCKYTEDGYCLRNENDYCKDDQCKCPHIISEIKVIFTCVTCETTQLTCTCCGEPLEPPKTDC